MLLDAVERFVQDAGIGYMRIDGSTPAAQRSVTHLLTFNVNRYTPVIVNYVRAGKIKWILFKWIRL